MVLDSIPLYREINPPPGAFIKFLEAYFGCEPIGVFTNVKMVITVSDYIAWHHDHSVRETKIEVLNDMGLL